MKKLSVTIFILLSCCYVFSQINTFTYSFSNTDNVRPMDIYEDSLGDIFVLTSSCEKESGFSNCQALLIKLDPYGNFIDSLWIRQHNRKLHLQDILLASINTIIICGMSANENDTKPSVEFYRVSMDLSLIDNHNHSFPDDYKWFSVKTNKGLNNSYLVTGGVFQPVNKLRVYVLRLSANLDSIQMTIEQDYADQGCYLMEYEPNRYWLLTGIIPRYLIMDGDFNVIQESKVPRRTSSPYGIKWDSDSSFYLTGEWNGGSDDDIGIIRQLHVTDTTDLIFNDWGTLDTMDLTAGLGALDFNNNDSIYIGGTTNFSPNYLSPFPSWYFLIQTDSMLNIRWEKFIGGEAHYTVDKIKAARDGGCFLASAKYDYMSGADHTDLELIKVNHLGQFVHLPENPSIEIREAIVYPNPGTDQLNIRLAAQHAKANFQLYDNRGGLIMNQTLTKKVTQINTNFLKSGTYVFRIYNENGLYEEGKWVKIQ